MAKAELTGRRGNYVSAYRHYGSQQPRDLVQALNEVERAVTTLISAQGSPRERRALENLAEEIMGLRERLDAATIDAVVRLRDKNRSVTYIARLLKTARPTIQGWLAKLDATA